jgi:hypothetical protein
VSIEQALQVIQWYCWRWRIERLFATLKQAGMDIESTQLESVEAIRRLTILALSVSLKALQLVMGREQPDLSAQVAFTQEELTCLTQLAPQLQVGLIYSKRRKYKLKKKINRAAESEDDVD